jgi:16S rRNA (cytosine967-C5)-methyltransferase
MPVSPARLAAFDILLKIERQAAYSSELLHSDALSSLSTADRGLTMELVMGVLRWRSRLDAQIARFSFTPFRKLDLEVLTALRLGVYQLEFLERVPARAAINESVELVKHAHKTSAAPLTNAVLRKIPKTSNTERAARHQASFEALVDDDPGLAERLAADFAHPPWLVQRWLRNYGAAAAAAICRYDQTVPATTIREHSDTHEARWGDAGVEFAPGALLRSARRVIAGHVIAVHSEAGHIDDSDALAIQDEGSQLVAALVGRGRRILDCCAAPGGKTAVLADLNPQAEIVATDLHPHRVRLMRRLLNAPNVRIIAADARALPLNGQFDRVLADVPCSGTGTLARNPEIKWRLTAADLADLQARQVAILRAALAQLAPGGRLVYSTCSLEPEENEVVVAEVLNDSAPGASSSANIKLVDIREELQRLRDERELVFDDIEALARGPFLRTIPGLHPCDGFFAAVIERG